MSRRQNPAILTLKSDSPCQTVSVPTLETPHNWILNDLLKGFRFQNLPLNKLLPMSSDFAFEGIESCGMPGIIVSATCRPFKSSGQGLMKERLNMFTSIKLTSIIGPHRAHRTSRNFCPPLLETRRI